MINIGVQGTDKSIMLSEHWDVAAVKATRLRVVYFDAKAPLDRPAATPST